MDQRDRIRLQHDGRDRNGHDERLSDLRTGGSLYQCYGNQGRHHYGHNAIIYDRNRGHIYADELWRDAA
jgi:hypothetical protein